MTITLWSTWLFVKVKIMLLCAFTGDKTKRMVLGCWETTYWQEYWFTTLFQISFDYAIHNHTILESILSFAVLQHHKGEIKHLGKFVGKLMTAGKEPEGRKMLTDHYVTKTQQKASNLLALLVKNLCASRVNQKVKEMVHPNNCFRACRSNKLVRGSVSICVCVNVCTGG